MDRLAHFTSQSCSRKRVNSHVCNLLGSLGSFIHYISKVSRLLSYRVKPQVQFLQLTKLRQVCSKCMCRTLMFELDIHFAKTLLILKRYVIGFPFPQGNAHAKTSEHVSRLSQQAICSLGRNERGFGIPFDAAGLSATWEIQCVYGAKLL